MDVVGSGRNTGKNEKNVDRSDELYYSAKEIYLFIINIFVKRDY